MDYSKYHEIRAGQAFKIQQKMFIEIQIIRLEIILAALGRIF